MSKLHIKLIDQENFVPKEGQCDGLMCSNKKSITHCPSLCYETVESNEKLNKAFDILFEEVFRSNGLKNNYESNHKISSVVCESLNI
jgi:hypothetical protein